MNSVPPRRLRITSVTRWTLLKPLTQQRSCMQFVKGDIQSLDLVSHVLASEKIDTIMHFAAQVRLQPCVWDLASWQP